ncbi:FAD-binding domain-containing protein [Punctularia strigosozonata HHB-11173 SS5]|uniref:FAD-binding domain-containing protein n=1 Tax=Punctularia strigosozonata (strain HHB-11173) TaxID=741275 RepID=UPI0004416FDC|nr:FAD-binding domain-containing protein [Punctularia strigosozonata HHB-11173 SS5]EIN11992.1 FAD-binding domain-containing protein [Punctularia strigosozonata HHB-11173 SS5]
MHALSLGFAALLARTVAAASFLHTCNKIAGNISDASAVFFPPAATYETDIFHVFSSSSQNSTCSVEPGTPQDVANILKILGQDRVPWAVKSGGHATNEGWSSTPGVQITLSRFNTTQFDPSTGIATVGTGQIWDKVYAALEPFNVSVAGSRISDVGVGFNLGGGYSWTTNQVGLSCDTTLEYELVTPTGKILTVNNETSPDLFFGLKGGGNNFGIVTQLKMTTKPQTAVFGGLVVLNSSAIPAIHDVLAAFQDNNTDPKAAISATYGFDPSQGGVFASYFLFYDAPTPPEGLFDALFALPTASNGLATQSYASLISALQGPPRSSRANWRSISIRNYTAPLLAHIMDQLGTNGPDVFNHTGSALEFGIELMLPTIFSHHAGQPTAYVHDPDNVAFPSLVIASWDDVSEDAHIQGVLKGIDESVVAFGNSEGQNLNSTFLYPNYASFDTPSERLFGDQIPRLRQIQLEVDPTGLTNLTGGWKFQ